MLFTYEKVSEMCHVSLLFYLLGNVFTIKSDNGNYHIITVQSVHSDQNHYWALISNRYAIESNNKNPEMLFYLQITRDTHWTGGECIVKV